MIVGREMTDDGSTVCCKALRLFLVGPEGLSFKLTQEKRRMKAYSGGSNTFSC